MIDLNDVAVAQVRYDIDAITARLRDTAHAWVPGLFPHGRRQGDEWRLANIRGDAPRNSGSCVIALKGDRAGSWHDFDGNQGGGALSTLEHGTGLTGKALFAHAADMTGCSPGGPLRLEPPPAAAKPDRDVSHEITFTLQRAVPLPGTDAETYLHGRGLAVPAAADLLFHPDLTHWETKTGFAALIGVVSDRDGKPIAIHRTYLTADGGQVSKAAVSKPRMMLGKTAGGAVRLAPIGPNGVLGLCEGIETGMAVMTACPTLPVWATLSTSGLEQIALPSEAQRILILADHDASGAGQRAAEAIARRLRADGRGLCIAMPPTPGDDFNDLLQREGAPAVVAVIESALSAREEAPAASAALIGRHLPMGFKDPAQPLPMLRADDGDSDRAVRRAWGVILQSNQDPWLFRAAGVPSWITPDDEGRPTPGPITEERLRHMLAKLANWRKIGPKGDAIPVPPPSGLMKSLLATPDPSLPVLAGIVGTPVFGRTGILLTEPGYHADARLLYQPQPGFAVPPIPDRPSAADIEAARSLLLDDLLGDFPFVGHAERAHALSLLLLSFLRAMIDGPTPLHLIEKPTPGTGATLMVDAIATILTGTGASVMTEGRDDEEWRKRITAKLRQIPAMVLIDNLRRELDSAAVAAALTAPFWEDRILGVSDMVRLPIRCVWIATGNNPSFSNEMARRLIRIRLDARVDQPWRRDRFRHPDLMGWVRANRGKLVAACLTLCRAWIVAGRPRGARSIGSYEGWAHALGGVMDVVGVEGFLGNLEESMEAADKEGTTWRAFVQVWWDRFGTAEVGAGDLFELTGKCDPAIDVGDRSVRSQQTVFGGLLVKMRDRVFRLAYRTVRIEFGRVLHKAQRWQLRVMDDADQPTTTIDAASGGNLAPKVGTYGEEVPTEKLQSGTAKWEPWEPGEPISTLAHTHAHAHVKDDLENGSPGSQGSHFVDANSKFAGEPTWEPGMEGSHPASAPSWLDGVP